MSHDGCFMTWVAGGDLWKHPEAVATSEAPPPPVRLEGNADPNAWWRLMLPSDSGGDFLLTASLSPDGRSSGADGAEMVVAVLPSSRSFGGGPRCGREVRVTSAVGREWSAMRNVDDAGHKRPTTTSSGTALSLRRMVNPCRRIDDFTACSPAEQSSYFELPTMAKSGRRKKDPGGGRQKIPCGQTHASRNRPF